MPRASRVLPVRWCVPAPIHAVVTAVLLCLAAAGCSGDGAGSTAPRPQDPPAALPPAVSLFAGSSFLLQSVNGTPLPARFEPGDIPGEVDDALILAALIDFDTHGFIQGTEDHQSAAGADSVIGAFAYRSPYTSEGNRVLIYAYQNAAPPDTGLLNGRRLTIRAQFYRGAARERYVLAMDYLLRD